MSSVNDDRTDNCFLQQRDRFSVIEEDEEVLFPPSVTSTENYFFQNKSPWRYFELFLRMLFHKRGMLVPFTVIKKKHKKSLSGGLLGLSRECFYGNFHRSYFQTVKVRCGFSFITQGF